MGDSSRQTFPAAALSDRVIDRLLAGLLAADRIPADLAAELDLRPQDLLAILESRRLAETCEAWQALHEQRAALLLSQLRAGAAVRLAQFLAGDDSETVRKACVDLLKAGATARALPRRTVGMNNSTWPPQPSPEFEAAALAELARLGRAAMSDDDAATPAENLSNQDAGS